MLSQNPPEADSYSLLNQGGRPQQPGRPNGGVPRGGPASPPGGVWGILHVIGGNDRGKSHPLNRPETTIGRGADQDCILADIAVSRRHITIVIEGPRYRMRDLGSGNGSLLNGVRTDTAILNDGDQIEIGNTLLRLEHPPSRPQQQQPMQQPGPGGVMRADAGASTMMADASQFPQIAPAVAARPATMSQQAYAPPAPAPISFPPPGGLPAETPSEAIRMPAPRPVTSSAPLPAPIHTGAHASPPGGGLLDTPLKKAVVFGAIGLVVLLSGALVVKKVFFNGAAEADKKIKLARKAYNDGDFDVAKKYFIEAQELVDSPQTAQYIQSCDSEIKAKSYIKTASGLITDKKFQDAIQTLDKIDPSSAVYEDARKLRRTAIGPAVADLVHDAQQAIEDNDLETAQTKVDAALDLDQDSADALSVEKKVAAAKVAAGQKALPSHAERVKQREKEHPTAKVAVREHHDARPPAGGKKPGKSAGGDDDDDDLATVSVTPSSGAGGDVLSIRTAAGPYRAKDFSGAAAAIRAIMKGEKGKPLETHTRIAARVSDLGVVYAKAESDKGRNPSQAISEYQQALGIDSAIAKGTHQGYFKSQIAQLAKTAARNAFNAQKWDEAGRDAQLAQRYGGDDGGIGAQIKAKAGELNAKAQAMSKSNLNGAKSLWRQVMKMVPPNDPNYIKAYQSLNAASAASKDEDE